MNKETKTLLIDIVESSRTEQHLTYWSTETIREAVMDECKAGNLEYFNASEFLSNEYGVNI